MAYIDEAGDDGLYGRVRPGNIGGASEWMVMAALVVRAENGPSTVPWLKNIIKKINQPQITHLHFRNLNAEKKVIVCEETAKLHARFFVVLSHKDNMHNYRNLAAEKSGANRTAWFYCWMSRLLLERVTHYCHYRSMKDHGQPRILRVEFSERGGVNIDDVRNYYRYISEQSKLGILHLDQFDLAWPVVDIAEMEIYPNRMRAGLQLADTVASAFYQAVERTNGQTQPDFAKLLRPRVCLRPPRGSRYGYGVKVMPTWIRNRLSADQREVLDFYAGP